MRRRIFLKDSAIGAGALVTLPTLFRECGPPRPPFPAGAINGFQESAEFFDLAIAELRIAGNGELGPAEAETFDNSKSDIFNLVEVTEQIYNKAEAPAEIAIDFAESAQELIDASSEMLEFSPELTPLSAEITHELAEDYAFLKVLKSSHVLESAASVDPFNAERALEASEMIDAAAEIYHALESAEPAEHAELIEGTEHLVVSSERYVGVSETFSGSASFELAVENYGEAVIELSEGLTGEAAGDLFAASENVFLSSEFYAEGIWNLETSFEVLGAPIDVNAEELVPFAELLVAEAEAIELTAQGDSAEIGAMEMMRGAEGMLGEAATDILNIYQGGETFEYGAEQYIAGTLAFGAEGALEMASLAYMTSAESLEQHSGNSVAETESLEAGSELILQASEDYFVAAEAFEFIANEFYIIEVPEIIESGHETIEIYNSVPDGPNPEVIIKDPRNIEIISADPVEFIKKPLAPEQIEVGGEIFNLARGNFELFSEVTEAEYVYPESLQGIQSLEAATLEMFEGAEYLLQEAKNTRSHAELDSAELSIEGAEVAIEGAIEAFETPEFVWDGAQSIEYGAIEIVEGALEFYNA